MSFDFAFCWIERQMGQLAVDDRTTDPMRLLARAASIFGEEFNGGDLARVLSMDETQLQGPLAEWRRRGDIALVDANEADCYRFTHPHTQQSAYGEIAPAVARALHAKAADVLGSGRVSVLSSGAMKVARQFERAGAAGKAIHWWQKAAELAISEMRPTVAVACLACARHLCDGRNDENGPLRELAILRLLGPIQAQLKGSGSAEVAEIYTRCVDLVGELSTKGSPDAFDAIWGLSACILVHGRVETARELCHQLVRAAQGPIQELLAARLSGLANLLAGNVHSAIKAFRSVVDGTRGPDSAQLRFRYASDQQAVALAHLAWAEAISGDGIRSHRTANAALARAEIVAHPHTSAHVVCVLAAWAQMLDLRSKAAPLARAGLTLADAHGFPYWSAWANLILGWHEGWRTPRAGLDRIEAAINAYAITGSGQALPFAHLLRSQVAMAAGLHEEAVTAADAGLKLRTTHGIMLFEAATLVSKAMATGHSSTRQQLLIEARDAAERQGALLFYRQASLALGRETNHLQLVPASNAPSQGECDQYALLPTANFNGGKI
jgi:hypothetical protein